MKPVEYLAMKRNILICSREHCSQTFYFPTKFKMYIKVCYRLLNENIFLLSLKKDGSKLIIGLKYLWFLLNYNENIFCNIRQTDQRKIGQTCSWFSDYRLSRNESASRHMLVVDEFIDPR